MLLSRRKKNKVEFRTAKSVSLLPPVARSIKFLPDWFKKLPKVRGTVFDMTTVKSCVPFIESMGMGITIPLWADLEVVVSEHYTAYDEAGNVLDDPDNPLIEYPVGTEVDFRGRQYAGGVVHKFEPKGLGTACRHPQGFFSEMLAPTRHSAGQVEGMRFSNDAPPLVWKLNSPWFLKTPKGYSTLYKNPSNNFDNDLTLFEGLVDTDTYTEVPVQFPFFWSGTEKGSFLIKKNTPIAQLIFVKRDDQALDFSISCIDNQDALAGSNQLSSKFVDKYRDMYWHKRKDE